MMEEWREKMRWVHMELKTTYEWGLVDIDVEWFGTECLCRSLMDTYSWMPTRERAYNYRNLRDLKPTVVTYGDGGMYTCIKDQGIIYGLTPFRELAYKDPMHPVGRIPNRY